jgi:serine protease DegS
VNFALKVLHDIVEYGYVVRGWLGIEVQLLPARVQTAAGTRIGLMVSAVEPGSPAEASGLRAGDLLVAINGQSTGEGRNAMQQIALLAPGERFRLEVLREGSPLPLEGTVGLRPTH